MSYTFHGGLSLLHSLDARFLDDPDAENPLIVEDEPITASVGVVYRVF